MAASNLGTPQQLQSLWSLGGLSWRELLRRVWAGINEDDLINRAYELAFNFLLAVFPLLLFLLALFGIFTVERASLRSSLFYYLQHALPTAGYQVVTKTINEVGRNAGAGKLSFGLVFALFAGSGGITQLMSTLNSAYRVREGRSWLKVHLISVGLTVGIAILTIVALLLILAGGQVAEFMGSRLGLSAAIVIIWKAVQWILALAFILLAFAAIYYFAPDVKEQHWYWITPGSATGLLLWIGASIGFRAYLHVLNTYSKTYGSLGAVIILMLWFYVTGLAFLVGGEINATIEHAAAGHGHPEAKAEGRKAA